MEVILMGGSGLIGRALAHHLLEGNHSVRILSRNPSHTLATDTQPTIYADRFSVHWWDGHSAKGWEDLMERADAIYNLAGENIGSGIWTGERKKRILASRLAAGQALVEAVRLSKKKPAVVIQSSAIGYYGMSNTLEFYEDMPAGQDFLARVAVQWEQSSMPVEEMGVRRIVIRTGVVLSTSQGVLPRFLLPFRFFVGGPIGTGKQVVSWIHIHDQVRAMRFLMESEKSRGAYNLTAPEPATNAEFGKEISRVIGRPYWFPTPGFALQLALGEMGTLVLKGQRVLPARLLAEGFLFEYPHLKDALVNLLQGSVQ
jgi:uncharacterized protein (TIGR01777 family)